MKFTIFSVALALASPVLAQTVSNAAYEIYNQSSGLPVVDAGYALGSGYSIAQEPDDHGADTHWEVTLVSGSSYKIINQISGLALVDAGYAKGNGYTIGQWPFDGGTDALWQFVSVGGGYYQIVNEASGLSLVDAGYNNQPGYSIAQWAYDGGADAKWLLTPTSGGSDYAWYELTSTPQPCTREPYGVIYNYNTAAASINAQLMQMFNSGQRSIKLPIYFAHGISDGTIMDSTGGNLAPQFRTNLTNLLAEIKKIGFNFVEVGFYAQGENAVLNNTTNWSTFNEPVFQETWNLIYNLHPIIAGAGIPYLIDLFSEGIPTTYLNNYSVSLAFTQNLWNYYVYDFGKTDTVGFSMITTSDRYAQLPNVYGNSPYGNHGYPTTYDLHIYANAESVVTGAYSAFESQGYNPPWIIGEAYYDDPSEPGQLIGAIQSTHQPIERLFQWPLTSQSEQGNCAAVNVAPPTLFSNYSADAF